MKKQYLMTPGPTPVPPQALEVMARPIFHHRTQKFQEILKEVSESLKYVFQTSEAVLTFASSGTGAMEGAVVNVLSPGDKVITVDGGKFGERWRELCQAYGANVQEIKVEWGRAVDPKKIEELLNQNPETKAVYTQLTETSTGVKNDIEAIGKIVSKTNAILVVDAISGLGADDLKTDDWKVDIAVAGSQKGLMIPPGLAFAAVSQKAWKVIESSRLPKYYFDFKKAKASLDKTDTPFTPAITLILALKETLAMLKEEGLENAVARHAQLAEAARAGVKALGLDLFAPEAPSNAVTAVRVPEHIDGAKIPKKLESEHGIKVAGGQGAAKGKIFRIAHMGYVNQFDVMAVISALEKVLKDLGHQVETGAGLKAAQVVLIEK